MNRPTETGLQLSGLVVGVRGTHEPDVSYELDTDPFRLAAGEIGVIAASPVVGTVLADVLLGLARPRRGEVWLNGVNVTARPPGARRIALVPAGGGLLPHLTVERNVAFGYGGRGNRRDRKAQANRVLRNLELDSLRRRRPHEISADQRMRVAVARAMCAPSATVAVVVEDTPETSGGQRGPVACRAAALTAASQELAVVLVTSEAAQAGRIPCRVQATCRAARTRPARTAGARPAGA